MKKILFLLAVVLAFASCEPKFEKEYSWAYPIAGDWMITAYYMADSTVAYGPYEMRAYNSSFGTDSIWIDDYASEAAYGNNPWMYGLKFKLAVNMSAKTFQTTDYVNALSYYGPVDADYGAMSVTITNGKIVGNDSIYMEVKFSDDPDTYIYAGHRETGYDEYMGNF